MRGVKKNRKHVSERFSSEWLHLDNITNGDDWSRRLEEESKRDPLCSEFTVCILLLGFERDHEAWQSCVCHSVTSGPMDRSFFQVHRTFSREKSS